MHDSEACESSGCGTDSAGCARSFALVVSRIPGWVKVNLEEAAKGLPNEYGEFEDRFRVGFNKAYADQQCSDEGAFGRHGRHGAHCYSFLWRARGSIGLFTGNNGFTCCAGVFLLMLVMGREIGRASGAFVWCRPRSLAIPWMGASVPCITLLIWCFYYFKLPSCIARFPSVPSPSTLFFPGRQPRNASQYHNNSSDVQTDLMRSDPSHMQCEISLWRSAD